MSEKLDSNKEALESIINVSDDIAYYIPEPPEHRTYDETIRSLARCVKVLAQIVKDMQQ